MNSHQSVKLKAIIFDFDGTLAELRLDFAQMKRQLRILAQDYFPRLPETPNIPALEWLETLCFDLQERDAAVALEFEERANSLITEIELEAAHLGSLFPFTRPVLQELRKDGIKVAIITRNCEAAVRIVFPDLDRYCAGFLARDHVHRVKPDPDHILRALEKIDAPPESALMVGDHPLDMQTGKRAGIMTAGVWSGYASQEDLLRAGANMTASNCQELILALRAQKLI